MISCGKLHFQTPDAFPLYEIYSDDLHLSIFFNFYGRPIIDHNMQT